MPSKEPSFEEVKAKAIELYVSEVGENPPDEPLCETLKLMGYWRRAKSLLLGKTQSKAKITRRVKSSLPSPSLLSPKEASRMLGVSHKTLWRWWKQGRIRAVRLPSGRLRYPKEEIEQISEKR